MLLSICRLIRKRWVDLWMRALEKVYRLHSDTVLVIGGLGYLEQMLRGSDKAFGSRSEGRVCWLH